MFAKQVTGLQQISAVRIDRRKLLAAAALAVLAGCQVVPKGPPSGPRPPERPDMGELPADQRRHRVALLIPQSGPNAAVGQSIANATTMALLDTNAENLRITTYDTSAGVGAAASRAIADGNKLILGPLLSGEIPTVAAAARSARVPVISFSNDDSAAGRDVFIMGHLPGQSIARTIGYAKSQGVTRFAALIPTGEYGEKASTAMLASVRSAGGTVTAMENYDRGNTSIASAVRRLRAKGGYDAVMIADGSRIARQAGPLLKPAAGTGPRILGTELWSGESAIATTPSLRGAWFSAVSDSRFRQFSESYRTRFGVLPHRIATLGYDSVLLTLRIARDWKPGTTFPTSRLHDSGGFLGLDGPFRFRTSGVIDRAFEVREVRAGGVTVASPAPARFGD